MVGSEGFAHTENPSKFLFRVKVLGCRRLWGALLAIPPALDSLPSRNESHLAIPFVLLNFQLCNRFKFMEKGEEEHTLYP